jgi:hypothetical protein
MKSYNPDKIYKPDWLKSQHYIHSSDVALGTCTKLLYDLVEKYPIAKIKHNKKNYFNQLDNNEVLYLCNNFYPFAFEPIVINKQSELKDGQHRLELAKWCGWEFIDVFVEKE